MGSLVRGDTLTVEGDLEVEGHVTVGSATTGTGVTVHGETGGSASPSLTVKGDGNVLFEQTTGSSRNRFEWLSTRNVLIAGKENGLIWGDDWGNGNIIFGNENMVTEIHTILNVGNSNDLFSSNNALNVGVLNLLWGSDRVLNVGDYNILWTSDNILHVGYALESDGSSYGISFGNMNINEDSSYTLSGGINNSLEDATGVMVLGEDNMGSSLNSALLVGDNLYSEASYCYILGRFNSEEHVGDGSLNWVETDPLFILANGTGDSNDPVEEQYRNAFTVYKNGDVEMTARVRMPAQGDILMGEFGNQNP